MYKILDQEELSIFKREEESRKEKRIDRIPFYKNIKEDFSNKRTVRRTALIKGKKEKEGKKVKKDNLRLRNYYCK